MTNDSGGPGEGLPPELRKQMLTAHAEEAVDKTSGLHHIAGSLENGAGKAQAALESLIGAFGDDSEVLQRAEASRLRENLEEARRRLHAAHMTMCRVEARAERRLASLTGDEAQ